MEIPVSMTFGNLIDEMAERYPDREALVFNNGRLTYLQLKQTVDKFAKSLISIGLKKGDKLAMILSNRTEWIVAALGCAKIGVVSVPLSTWYKKNEINYALNHCDASVLLLMTNFLKYDYLEMFKELIADGNSYDYLKQVITVGDSTYENGISWGEFLKRSSSIPDNVLQQYQENVDKNDICYILYTSGTTSTPKGVQIIHHDMIVNTFNIGERIHLSPKDKVWIAVPLAWGFGAVNALPATFTHGACAVLQEYFDPETALLLYEKERITVWYGMPNMVQSLINHPMFDRTYLKTVERGLTIGLPKELKCAIDELGIPYISNIYGSTETYGNSNVTDSFSPLQTRIRTQGKALPGVTIRIVDLQTRQELPIGEVGEIEIGGFVTPGYYKDEKKNRDAFTSDHFYKSGDLGYLDERGYLNYQSRIKDMIKTGGINVSPSEIEEFLMTHPCVQEAYVIGVPDRVKYEIPVAYIQLKSDFTNQGELYQYCKENLANYKVPQKIIFIEEEKVPRTVTGKVNKVRLKELCLLELQNSNK